ncbi:3-hydroxyacyl-CoA dehydrogenase [Aspergillus taichungensis]|uniref:3-hydroxyacyl-CoA dehydrogenase n=1 Tax=Aspergillus taichungensis TaxID=482145 RepID=A0A2J5HJM7_9EURO|nr:3-hydroxyacyl-CoA dehydrogenase [Aspergillus taichungensis]
MIAPTDPVTSSNSVMNGVTQYNHEDVPQDTLFEKVIIIVGGSNGIGASLAELCCSNTSYVCIGDIDDTPGEALARKCQDRWPAISDPNQPPKPPRASYRHVDVTDYQSVVDFFEFAFTTYKRIDHVVVTAGSMATGDNWFDQSLSFKTVREPPSSKDIDVNLTGSLYVTRVASVYLRHNRGPWADRSILLFSCAAGFKEMPGVPIYQVAKHGIQGLMRSLRTYFPSPYTHNLRINTICPWMTQSRSVLTKSVEDSWNKEGLPISTYQEVARVSAGVLGDSSLNGTSMFVEGDRAWEIERNIDRLEPQWLGKEPSRALGMGQTVLRDALV